MTYPPGFEQQPQPQGLPPDTPIEPPPPGYDSPPAAAPAGASQLYPSGSGDGRRGRVRGTRVSALWIGLIAAAILLILLLIFIAQNSRTVTIHYLGLRGHLSLAVALLLAAVLGVLLVAIPGTARIVQLRRALRRNTVEPPPGQPR